MHKCETLASTTTSKNSTWTKVTSCEQEADGLLFSYQSSVEQNWHGQISCSSHRRWHRSITSSSWSAQQGLCVSYIKQTVLMAACWWCLARSVSIIRNRISSFSLESRLSSSAVLQSPESVSLSCFHVALCQNGARWLRAPKEKKEEERRHCWQQQERTSRSSVWSSVIF